MNLDKLKPIINKMLKLVSRLQIVIVSLVILVLFGVALLQVNEAIDPTIDDATLQQAQQDNLLKRVKYDKRSLDKVRELTNIEVNLEPSNDSHSDNPFSNE